jgi:hypothetical protein
LKPTKPSKGPDSALVLRTVLLTLSPLALAPLVASWSWSVEEMAAGAPWRLVGFAPAPCPGCAACGLSRAFTAWSHGDVALAASFNPSVLAVYPTFWVLALAGPALVLLDVVRRIAANRPAPLARGGRPSDPG